MLLSAWYVVLQRVLQLVVLRFRSREFKDWRSSCCATRWRSCAVAPVDRR